MYRGFIDPSGGSEDSMTLAIAHKTPKPEEMVVIDVIREARPPFSPEAVVDEFAALCKLYRITKITGDHFGGEFVKEPFRRHGLSYEIAKQPKSDLYRDLLPLLNSGRIMLPKHDRLVSQIVGLERRVSAPARIRLTTPRTDTTTWRTALPARRRSPTSADTTRACAGCRATTTSVRRRRRVGSWPAFGRKRRPRRTKRALVRNMAGPFHFRGTANLGKS